MLGMFRSLLRYRNFVFSSIRNELKGRFARSKLGGMWMIINPLSQVLIYTLILSNVLAAKIPGIENKYSYAIYLMAGLLSWSLFSEIVNRCSNLFVSQGELMKKMNFPRITLPAIVFGSSILNYVLLVSAMLVIFLLLGHQFSFVLAWLVPITALTAMFALSIGLTLGIINVFLRDVGHVIPIVMQVLFWFTPIIYPETIIPEKYQPLMDLNPMYHIVHAYHNILVYNQAPSVFIFGFIGPFILAMLAFSLFLFRRAGPEMADVL